MTDSFWNQPEPDVFGVLGLGFSVGAKYVRSSGLLAEIVSGIGRALSGDNFYPRFGIQLGQRF